MDRSATLQMALLAHRKLAGLHLFAKREARSMAFGSDLPTLSVQRYLLSRLLYNIQRPVAGAAFPTSQTAIHVQAVNAVALGMTNGSEQTRERQDSHSQATSSHSHVQPPPLESKGWPNGGGMVHPGAEVHISAFVEYGAVVQAGAVVEKDVRIGACSVVGPNVRIGERTVLW